MKVEGTIGRDAFVTRCRSNRLCHPMANARLQRRPPSRSPSGLLFSFRDADINGPLRTSTDIDGRLRTTDEFLRPPKFTPSV